MKLTRQSIDDVPGHGASEQDSEEEYYESGSDDESAFRCVSRVLMCVCARAASHHLTAIALAV